MDSIIEYTNQNSELEFIVSLDYNLEDFSDYECIEWGDLYETLGIYDNNPLIINGDTDFDYDGYYDHYIWNLFAGNSYSSYAILDHHMVVRYLLDFPDYNNFQNIYLPNLVNEMYGCSNEFATNYNSSAVYNDNSCIFGGDFNQDSNIDINDVIILVNLVIGNQLGADTDLNDDNNSDILDIISLINFIIYI
ncbi:MAG: hypothetical protein CBD21_04690 [bacterium TMED161]|nr:MAG: hypothetical protein CBD21_04690 [bacterium TMED161]|tara:strand:+ start:10294 stop:10869 length:576 start_codon:yes stop_codon:yes gene_type:complete